MVRTGPFYDRISRRKGWIFVANARKKIGPHASSGGGGIPFEAILQGS